jgi:hypothetical protein
MKNLLTLAVLLSAIGTASPLLAESRSNDYGGQVNEPYNPQSSANKARSCPVRRLAGGDLVDCHGWRLSSDGWDNSCFNLDHLSSQFACSPPKL